MSQEFQSSKPIYMQIVDKIIINIVQGKQQLGEKLPSVREMALKMGVNPNTIQRTYSELERMNIVETKRGQGTFVVENEELLHEMRKNLQLEIIDTFVKQMEEIGIGRNELLAHLHLYLEGDENNDN